MEAMVLTAQREKQAAIQHQLLKPVIDVLYRAPLLQRQSMIYPLLYDVPLQLPALSVGATWRSPIADERSPGYLAPSLDRRQL